MIISAKNFESFSEINEGSDKPKQILTNNIV